MEYREAQEALRIIEQIEARASSSPTPWLGITATGIVTGVAFSAALMEKAGLTAIAVLATIILVVVMETTRKRAVRVAMKQEVRTEEETWSWKRFLLFMAAYTVIFGAIQLLPRENLPVAATTGAVTAAVLIAAAGLTWKRWN